MNLNEYQDQARTTAVFPDRHAMSYTALGLVNEAGEYAGKIKKVLRGDFDFIDNQHLIADELGDVLWYLAGCADVLGVTLEEVAQRNLAKLRDRASRGVIKGSGDVR